MEDPREDLVVHYFYMCGDGALLGGLVGICWYMEHEFLYILSYPRILLSVFAVHHCVLLWIFYFVMCSVFLGFQCALVALV